MPIDANYVRLTVALRQNQCATKDKQACNIDCSLSDWKAAGTCDAKTGTQVFAREVLSSKSTAASRATTWPMIRS